MDLTAYHPAFDEALALATAERPEYTEVFAALRPIPVDDLGHWASAQLDFAYDSRMRPPTICVGLVELACALDVVAGMLGGDVERLVGLVLDHSARRPDVQPSASVPVTADDHARASSIFASIMSRPPRAMELD